MVADQSIKLTDAQIEERRLARNRYHAKYRAEHPDQTRKTVRKYYAANIERRRADAMRWNAAHPEQRAQTRAAYKERAAAYSKAYASKHPDRARAKHAKYRAAHKERTRAACRAWSQANPAHVTALAGKRRASERRQTPLWADIAAIRAVYRAAARLTRETGVSHDVDHIYPLRGQTVSGLHVAANLQVLTHVDNMLKSNKQPR